ncbi:enoyl-CoA hydratase/isomerase family protein [Falsiroseomonas oryziterrae]|uniref:enoyl-CoA hydratase/isomerase family protein n=1 Tax=Falsiroseomonas oryziterrae TaxID=2911368 RepID=UPI001F2A670B|nr:enoyl-CoA hydratase/isomerase family protein [Roseomonas sp. NPKOSM-4]
MSEAELLVSRDGAVVRAVLNRPSRRNAMDEALVARIDALLAELKHDKVARVLVISGAGGHFCAGLDLTEVGAPEDRATKLARQQERNRRMGARFQAIADLPQVVIAAVEGSAFAGGLGFVCAADVALAAPSARFCAPEVRRGLVPAQILPWLARRMGRSAAARLCLQGNVIGAEAAAAIGLVHDAVSDLDAAVAATVAEVLEGAPGAIAETKALIAALGPVVPEGYAEAGAAAFARRAASEEAAEGIASFGERRRAAWAPRRDG